MDHEYALRLVIFEYLLPVQRQRRFRILHSCIMEEIPTSIMEEIPTFNLGTIFEQLLHISDNLLAGHGFTSSFVFPVSMHHSDYRLNARRNVYALVDSNGPMCWSIGEKTRTADPKYGVRTFNPGQDMSAGLLRITI